MENKKTINMIIIIIVAVAIVLIGVTQYNAGKKQGIKETEAKLRVTEKQLSGTFKIPDEKDKDNPQYIAILKKIDPDSKKIGYYWYDSYATVLRKGKRKITNRGYVILYKKNKPQTVIFRSNNKYYMMNENKEPVKIKRIDSTPTIPY